ncbi:MAG: DUF2341 domain-containing protein [Chitinispirillaceae bacterium]|nr:DUF2341 domain-containing protein [Chitinispirillaceae bacterium]
MDGSGDYAELGDYLNLGSNNFTVSAWVKRSATGASALAGKTNGDNPSSLYGWTFGTTSTDNLIFYLSSDGAAWGDAGSFSKRSSTTLSDLTSWHYVAAVINRSSSDSCKIYIDGVDRSGTTEGNITTVGQVANTLKFRIGSEADGGFQWNGAVDEVRTSFTARSADWIKLCYETQKSNQTVTGMEEDYTTWSHSGNININTTGITTTDCYAFPFLVRLTSGNFNFSEAQSAGQDIRFAKSDGTPLSYQIERWDSTSSSADIWVRIDTVFGNNSSQFFVMYWGKSTVSSKSDASAVFDTATGFRCVWHLSEASGGPTDATLNAYTGTLRNAPSQNQSGIIGKAFTFNPASTQGIYNNSRVVSAFPFTVSTWVKRTAYATDHCLIFLGDKDVNDVSYLTILNTSDHLKVRSQNTTGYFSESSQTITDSAWHLIHTVYKSNTEKIGYIDGVPVCTLTTNVTFSSAVDRFAIGYISGLAPGNFFKGSLDEFRAEQGERSTDWIRLCYETQKDNQLIITMPRKKLLPITVQNNIGSGTSDTCLVYTDNWSIIFDEDEGGQIKFLSNQSNASGTNQMSATNQRNMFSVEYGQGSYNVSGVLSIIEITPVSVTIGNTYALSSVTFTEEYTVDGAGRIYLKIRADNNSGSNQTQQLSFLTFRDEVGAAIRKTKTATASTCPYVLNTESYDTNQFDILLSIYDLWTDATTFTSSSNDYSCLGYTDNSFSIANNNRKIWEFMIDFSSKDLCDTSATTDKLSNDYRTPDSLEFYAGTRGMEQTWEHHLYGHWPFESSSGDTAYDLSGNNFNAYSTGTFTTSGRWGNGLQLNGSQSATIPNNLSLNGDSRFTVMAWIKVASFGASSVVLSKHDGLNGWKLTGNASNQVTLHLGGTQLSGVTNVADNQWHHIAANLTPWENNITIFVDGKIDSYYPSNYTVTAATADLIIGSGLTGTIDDVRFYGEHVSESTLKSIYQLGYRSATGAYHLRADNNNAVFFSIDGGTTQHNFPSFTIENYWATSKPAAGCVTLNGSALTENTDYYAYLDDIRNTLKITLNKNISTDGNLLYIDDNYPSGYQSVGATKKMSWGVNTLGTNQYVWVKNFPSNTFGTSTSNEWYINWNMSRSGSAHPSRDGDIWYMASSVEKANTAIDTASTNLIPGSDASAYYSTLGNLNFVINSVQVRTSENVTNTFTYQIAESSSVRIRLRVNERQVSSSSQSYSVVTEHTIYPTGQIFRYDSLYQFNVAPTTLWAGWFLRDQTNTTTYSNKTAKRGAVLYSSGYPDFSAAWLGMRNASGYQAQPFDSDSMTVTTSAYRVGFNFADLTLTSAWNSSSIEIGQYCDMQKTTMTSAFVDSTSKSVQNIGLAGGAALAMIKGSLVTTATGDLNTDGFNERQGAYIINAEDNTVNFKIPSRNDTCRFYPAFVIRNYYAPRKPDYVFGYNGSDTTVLLDGYQYNAYLNSTARELVMQFDSVFCDSAGIYISADKTLAVSISEFLALGGILSDTIRWQTESEQENLGFHIFRRIRPEFIDSIQNVLKNSTARTPLGRAGTLFKSMAIDTADTQWVRITTDLIPGAPAGASVGPVKYQFIDNSVYDSLHYQYKLEAIDFKNRGKIYGPVNAMPFAFIKYLFRLGRNYPNPFRGYTVIHFTLPENMKFSLDVYDLQGRLVRQLIRKDKPYNAGMYRVIWDGTNSSGQKTAAGTYIYHLNSKRYKKAFTMLYVGM